MVSAEAEEKVKTITEEAIQCLERGNLKQATILLRQASSIAPNNPSLESAWNRLKDVEDKSNLVQACVVWLKTTKVEDGKLALNIVLKRSFVNNDAKEAFELLLSHYGENNIADKLTGLLMESHAVKTVVGDYSRNNPTRFFEQMFERGDLSIEGLVSILLDTSSWRNVDNQLEGQKNMLQLALAKLMDVDIDHLERAMKVTCRLLAMNALNLYGVVESSGLSVILDALNIRSRSDLRSYAILAVAKLMESVPDKTQEHLTSYITTQIADPTADRLIAALSTAAMVFPIATEKAVALFLSPGFISSLIPLIEMKDNLIINESMLELLSAACVDKACRQEIREHCTNWLTGIASSKLSEKNASLASLVLVKIKDKDSKESGVVDQDSQTDVLVSKFQSLILSSNEKERVTAVEGLAYTSLDPNVKEILAKDEMFLKNLTRKLAEIPSDSPFAFGALSILSNLTSYPPVLSEKQRKLLELKAYANASKPTVVHSRETDSSVSGRCKAVINAGILPVLISISRTASYALFSLIAKILLSLNKEITNRGLLAQQGAVKLLIRVHERLINDSSNDPDRKVAARDAAQALARVLISVNPHHAFPRSTPVSSTLAVRHLTPLLHDDPYSEERDLLPTFEALLALTNLASTDDETRDVIIRLSWAEVENLLLSSNVLVQRASTELICNLMASPQCVTKFADGSKSAANRLHILLGLADMDDTATRRAAAGALAMLSEWDTAANAIIEREKGIKILLQLCAENSEEMKYRGIASIHNLVLSPAETGRKGKQQIQVEGGIAIIKTMLKESRDHKVISLGADCLKSIL